MVPGSLKLVPSTLHLMHWCPTVSWQCLTVIGAPKLTKTLNNAYLMVLKIFQRFLSKLTPSIPLSTLNTMNTTHQRLTYILLYPKITGLRNSTGRGFGSGYFSYSAPILGPKHIRTRSKEDRFWPRLRTEVIEPSSASVRGFPRP